MRSLLETNVLSYGNPCYAYDTWRYYKPPAPFCVLRSEPLTTNRLQATSKQSFPVVKTSNVTSRLESRAVPELGTESPRVYIADLLCMWVSCWVLGLLVAKFAFPYLSVHGENRASGSI